MLKKFALFLTLVAATSLCLWLVLPSTPKASTPAIRSSIAIDMNFGVMSGEEVERFVMVTNHLVPRLYFDRSDDVYILPTQDWLNRQFVPSYQFFLTNFEVDAYMEQSNDCDKFTIYACTVAQILSSQFRVKAGLAFGQMSYYTESFQEHALNIIVAVDSNYVPTLVFYDGTARRFRVLNETNMICPLSIKF